MTAARTSCSRDPREAPAGLHQGRAQSAPIVLIRAGEEILADRAVRSLLAQARARDPTTEITRLEVVTCEPHQLDTLVSPSLFGEPQLVYISALEQMADALLSDLIAYMGAADPEVSVILRHNGGRRSKRLLDAIKTSPYPTIQYETVKNAKDKSSLVVANVRRAGRSITPEAVGALVGVLSSDLRELYSTVDQFLTDTQDTISADHIRTYYAGRIETTSFTVADAAAAGNTPAAITALRRAVTADTNPVTIIVVLTMRACQLTRVTATGGGRMSPAELDMTPWQVNRAHRELQGWSDDTLATSILAVARADTEARGASHDPVYAVERTILTVYNARRSDSRRR